MADKKKKIITSGRATIGSQHVVHSTAGGQAVQLTVRAKCGSSDAKPMCITHDERFDNAKALAAHLADKKDHITGWWCPEESTEQRGVDAFNQPQMVSGPHGLESDREIETE